MYRFYMPTKVIAGEGCVLKNGKEIAELGKKAMVVTGKNSGRKSGALQDVLDVLNEYQMEYEIYDRIENNPTLDCVVEAGIKARSWQPDLIIGIGGGSPLDAAKAIAVLANNDIPGMDLYNGNYPNKPLPIVAIPTTAGTGSEVTPYAVLTLKDIESKKGFTSEQVFPKVAFLDAVYTEMLPHDVTVHTAVDALSHALEGFTATRSSVSTDYIALEAIKLFADCMPQLKIGDLSLVEREKLLRASMLAGIVIAHTGTTIVHSMGYSLTYFRNIPHGKANGLLLAEYLRFLEEFAMGKVNEVLEALQIETIDAFAQQMTKLLDDNTRLLPEEIEKYVSISIQATNSIHNTLGNVTKDQQMRMFTESLG